MKSVAINEYIFLEIPDIQTFAIAKFFKVLPISCDELKKTHSIIGDWDSFDKWQQYFQHMENSKFDTKKVIVLKSNLLKTPDGK